MGGGKRAKPRSKWIVCKSGNGSAVRGWFSVHAGVSARAASIVTDSGFESAGANGIYFAGQSLDGGA